MRPRLARLPAPLLAAALQGCAVLAAPAGEHYIDERTGLDAWRREHQGLSLTLVQRLPDQTRAFFLARGFSRAAVDELAASCVFQAIIGNTGNSGRVELDLHQWGYSANGRSGPLRLKEDWMARWAERGESMPARVAFRWSFFPTVQRFAPNDWNMGMISFPVPPGTVLDVHFRWTRDGRGHHGVLRGVRCASDRSVEERPQ